MAHPMPSCNMITCQDIPAKSPMTRIFGTVMLMLTLESGLLELFVDSKLNYKKGAHLRTVKASQR